MGEANRRNKSALTAQTSLGTGPTFESYMDQMLHSEASLNGEIRIMRTAIGGWLRLTVDGCTRGEARPERLGGGFTLTMVIIEPDVTAIVTVAYSLKEDVALEALMEIGRVAPGHCWADQEGCTRRIVGKLPTPEAYILKWSA